jgi:integrase
LGIVLVKGRAKASKTGPSNDGRARHARNQLTQAAAFLAWLSEHHTTLAATRQADLDYWAVDKPANARANKAFLVWCMANKTMPTLVIPAPAHTAQRTAPMDQTTRIQTLHRLLTDPKLPLRSRTAGALVLLYAQPVSKIVGLRVTDITTHADGQTTLNLGTPPSPVPDPLAGLLNTYLQARPNMTTATNPDSIWLFPGRRAGLPLHPRTMTGLLQQAGVPARTSRIAAIRSLALQLPAPVIADALGYHHTSATRIAAEAGSPWSGYAAGDHSRGPVACQGDGTT